MTVGAQPSVEVQHWPTDVIAKAERLNNVNRSTLGHLVKTGAITSGAARDLGDTMDLMDKVLYLSHESALELETACGRHPAGFNEAVDNIVRMVARR